MISSSVLESCVQKDPEGFYKLSWKVSNVSVTEKELGMQHVHFQNREFFFFICLYIAQHFMQCLVPFIAINSG